MRKIAILVFILYVSATGFCQARFGVKAGINYYELDAKNNNENNFYNGQIGVTLGFLYELPISDAVAIQPELNYSYRQTKANYLDNRLKLGYFEVPVLCKYKVPSSKIAFVAGPQFSFLSGARLKSADGTSSDWKGNLLSTDVGITAGVGHRPAKAGMTYDLRVTKGFMNVIKAEYDGGIKTRSILFSATIGYLF